MRELLLGCSGWNYGNTSDKGVLRAYFNNHYGGAAVLNALQFKEMLGNKLSENERNTIEHALEFLSTRQSTFSVK